MENFSSATNGDIIKLLFPKLEYDRSLRPLVCAFIRELIISMQKPPRISMELSLWNEPYKGDIATLTERIAEARTNGAVITEAFSEFTFQDRSDLPMAHMVGSKRPLFAVAKDWWNEPYSED